MDTSLIWEKVNGQGLVNFRNLMDSLFNFQNNNPLSPSKKTRATMDKTSLTLGEWSIFRGYANFVYCRVTVQGETVKISKTFYGQIRGQD